MVFSNIFGDVMSKVVSKEMKDLEKKMISSKLWFFYAMYPLFFVMGLTWYLYLSDVITDLEFCLLIIIGTLLSTTVSGQIANYNCRIILKGSLDLHKKNIGQELDMINKEIERRKQKGEVEQVVLK